MLLLILIFLFVTLLQILIWGLFPARFLLFYNENQEKPSDSYPGVSVIIAARNEAENLLQRLPFILGQDYPAPWEVIVVDDNSADDTLATLRTLQQQYPQLQIISAPAKQYPGKKAALETGIKAARFDWLALTDADCQPTSAHWLTGMMEARKPRGIVLGFAPMEPGKGWLHYWARYETLYTALQYCATAFAGWPFMGVGRNLVYHKDNFGISGGFAAHQHLPGGDDDLLVNAAAHRQNTSLCLKKGTWMYSPAKSTLKGWIQQKYRHVSAGVAYKTWHNLVLGGVAFTHAVHYGLAAILLLVAPEYGPWIAAAYFARMLVVWPVMAGGARRLGERALIPFIPIFDGLLAVWLGAVAPFMLVFRKRDW